MVSQALKTKEMKVLLKCITKTAKTNMYVTSWSHIKSNLQVLI